MKKKRRLAAGIAVAIICILAGLEKKVSPENLLFVLREEPEFVMENPEDDGKKEVSPAVRDEEQNSVQKETSATAEMLVVHICGAVRNPGIYFLEAGSRLYQAVDAAGGFLEDAGEEYLNLADALTDGEKIYIPTVSEAKEENLTKELNGRGLTEAVSGERVNINTASAEMLCTLPGIGSSKAESIISYREVYGAFQSAEDIMKVEGIKNGLFQKIKDKITV